LDKAERDGRIKMIIEYGGIFPPLQDFYILSIIDACKRALEAYYRSLNHLNSDADTFSYIHEFLVHAASLSRFFDPARKNNLHIARAKALKNLYGQDTKLVESRNARNALEHYDERLDEYLLRFDSGYYFPEPKVGALELTSESIGHVFKLYDPTSQKVAILGEVFDIAEVLSEVYRLLQKSKRLSNSNE